MKTIILAAALLASASTARAQARGEIGRKLAGAPPPAAGKAQAEVGHKTVGLNNGLSYGPALPSEFASVVRKALRAVPDQYGRVEVRREEMAYYLKLLDYEAERAVTYGRDARGSLRSRDDRGFTVLIWESPEDEPATPGSYVGRAFVLDVPFDGLGTAAELEVRYAAPCAAARETCAPVSADAVVFGDGPRRQTRKLWAFLEEASRPPSSWPF